MNKINHNELINQLIWQIESGADESIGDKPRNHILENKTHESKPQKKVINNNIEPINSSVEHFTPSSSEVTSQNSSNSTIKIASNAKSLTELSLEITNFNGCALRRTATNTVIYDGNPESKLMIIGEAPGAEEDKIGTPFVGPAGKLLDKMLESISCDRNNCFITNIVNWRPPGNRSPTLEEINLCRPFVERQIELVQPSIIILLGGIAAKTFFNRKEGITRLRGKWNQIVFGELKEPIDTIATFHPAYLLRQPTAKREVWQDFLKVSEKINIKN